METGRPTLFDSLCHLGIHSWFKCETPRKHTSSLRRSYLIAHLAVVFASCTSPKAVLLEQGARLLQEEKLEDAIAVYSNVLSLDTLCAEAFLNRGLARERLELLAEALQDYDRAYVTGGDLTEALKCRVLLRLHMCQDARERKRGPGDSTLSLLKIASLEALLDMDLVRLGRQASWDPEAYALRGRFEFYRKKYNEAAEAFTRMLRLSSSDAWGYNQRGRSRFEMSRYDEAINDYSRALQIDKTTGWVYYNRALAWEALGNPEKAERDYSQALECDSTDAWAYYLRGLLRWQKGDTTSAEQDRRKAIMLGIPDSTAYLNE